MCTRLVHACGLVKPPEDCPPPPPLGIVFNLLAIEIDPDATATAYQTMSAHDGDAK